MKKITPFLWFSDKAEEAAKFYVSTFANSRIVNVRRDGARILSVTFRLDGLELTAFNGGPRS
jgi:predicted 3-demethylubiquinone-9 3-methyltransferase (glyoxalase superfamily)